MNDRVTLNLGLRVDRFQLFLPAQEHPAGRVQPDGADVRQPSKI